MSDISDMAMNQSVTFRSKNIADNVLYKGRIDGISLNYNIAKSFGDILSYHTAVLKVDPEIHAKETLTYFIITLDDPQSGTPATRVFSTAWIEAGSFVILDTAVTTTITITEVSESDLAGIIEILQSKGYYYKVS